MTVTYIGEKFPRPTSKSLQNGIDGTRKFQFTSDTPNELEANVYNAVDAQGAFLGSLFPGTITSQCIEQRATQDEDDRQSWYVICQYKSILNQVEQERITNPNPLDRAARIAWGSRTVNEAVYRMLQAKTSDNYFAYQIFDNSMTFQLQSVANAASDPFDPPLEVPITQWLVCVSKNVTVAPTWALTYDNAVNNGDFVVDGLTVPKGCAKLEGIRIGEKMKENGTVFRPLQFNIILKTYRELRASETVAPEPWDIEVLNEGLRGVGPSNKWKNFKETGGADVTKPIPINNLGEAIDPSGNPIPASSLFWCLFRPFKRKDFAVLPLT